MDLKFIWIKEHRAIKDLNFNFCHDGEHQFHYDGKKIEIFENKKSPIVFSEKITGLTAIAGKNGSGKSSFCEAVLYATATLQENSFGIESLFDGIVCFDQKIYIQNDLIVQNIEQIKKIGYEVQRFKDSPLEQELGNRRDPNYLGHLGFVYYSNSFDFKSDVKGNNLSNISTSFRLYNDKYYSNYVVDSECKLRSKLVGDCRSQMNIFHSEEHYRILKFILNFPDYAHFVNDSLLLSVNSTYSGNNKFLKHHHGDSELENWINKLENSIFDSIYEYYPEEYKYVNKDSHKLRSQIHKLYKLNLISILCEKYKISTIEIDQFIEKSVIPKSIKKTKIGSLIEIHFQLLTDCKFDPQFLVNDSKTENSQYKDWRFKILNRFFIYFSSNNQRLLKDFISLENEILNYDKSTLIRISNFSLFSFFSTGELSLLSLYARIYEVILGYQSGIYNKQELILFLDEPESGYHPNWSKQMIKRLCEFLEKEFNSFKIQLIITTHSPFILSDLPKENIRLFNRVEKNPPALLESKSNTFGANIYDLLHDSFFMSEGFIGSFAQEKIDEVYSELSIKIENTKYILKIDKSYIKSIISIVGEPLIQRQLSSLYDRVFNEDLEVEIIDRQMEALKKLKERKLKVKK